MLVPEQATELRAILTRACRQILAAHVVMETNRVVGKVVVAVDSS